MKAIGGLLKVSGVGLFLAVCLWGTLVSLGIVSDAWGFWAAAAAFLVAPFVFALAPWYAGLACENWFPLALNYGGATAGLTMTFLGARMRGE